MKFKNRLNYNSRYQKSGSHFGGGKDWLKGEMSQLSGSDENVIYFDWTNG